MTREEAFAEAVLQRVAEIAYDELKTQIDAYARSRAGYRTSAPTTAVAGVVDISSRRGRRAS